MDSCPTCGQRVSWSIRRRIPGFPLYSVDAEGSLFGQREQLLVPFITNKGYYQYAIRNEDGKMGSIQAQVAVLLAFVGPRPTPTGKDFYEASHLDGDPSNNRLENLAWETHQQNMDRMVTHMAARGGPVNYRRGEDQHLAVLTAAQVVDIRRRYLDGDSQYTLAKAFNVSRATIAQVVNRRTWRHL